VLVSPFEPQSDPNELNNGESTPEAPAPEAALPPEPTEESGYPGDYEPNELDRRVLDEMEEAARRLDPAGAEPILFEFPDSEERHPRSVNELLHIGGRLSIDDPPDRTPVAAGQGSDPAGPLAVAVAPGLLDEHTLGIVGRWLDAALAAAGNPEAVRLRAGRGIGLRALRGVEHLIALRLLRNGFEVRICPLNVHVVDRDWALLIGAAGLITFEPVGVIDHELDALRRLARMLGVPVDRRIVPATGP